MHSIITTLDNAFWEEAKRRDVAGRVEVLAPVEATTEELERFHPRAYLDQVRVLSVLGEGFLDCGDTPAFPGVFEAGAYVVGTTLDACRRVMRGDLLHAFVPIAGLHHGRRDSAGGFCVFNDIGVAVEMLRHEFGIERVLYVDIDAHHGDGVFYEYESDPSLYIVDFHEDGRFLFPGTGDVSETGTGAAAGDGYLVRSAFARSPGIKLPGGSTVPLAVDTLFWLSGQVPWIFRNFTGVLDGKGGASASVAIPKASALVGLTFYTSFVSYRNKAKAHNVVKTEIKAGP